MRIGGMPPNTVVVNTTEGIFILLCVPGDAEIDLPEGWEVTETPALDLVRIKLFTQLNVVKAKEALPTMASFVV